MSCADFPLELFAALMRETPAQPATNLWRAVELDALIHFALPKITAGRTLLDLGCGDGGVLAVLKPYFPAGISVLGLDADEDETGLAKQRDLYSRLMIAGADRIPLDDASVDVVLSNSVLEHVGPIEGTLKECGRVLRSGGLFMATVPGPDFHRCLSGSWLPWVRREAYEREIDGRLSHLRYWTKDEWKKQLDAAGLDLAETHAYLPLRIMRRWELLSRVTGGLLYSLSGKRDRPIRIQRAMGLRRKRGLPFWFVKGVSRILSRGLGGCSGPLCGCLLVIGRKP